MELGVLEVPKPQAERAFKAYQAAVKERHNAEDEQIMRGYKEILAGRQIISLRRTLSSAGLDPKGYPKLAIINAEAQRCWVRMCGDGSAEFWNKASNQDRGGMVTASAVRTPMRTFPVARNERGWDVLPGLASAIVPIVPPQFRPARGLGGYHVLWEAEWRREAPKDPALLKYCGGDLWAVVAVWDLTEVERAVLMGRA